VRMGDEIYRPGQNPMAWGRYGRQWQSCKEVLPAVFHCLSGAGRLSKSFGRRKCSCGCSECGLMISRQIPRSNAGTAFYAS
jgi:hypothetical protein